MARVSIIVPVKDGASTVRRTLDSAIGQVGESPEIIVVDDGSTDGTAQILSSYGDRIKVRRQRNSGPSIARNAGAAMASSDSQYLLFLDADDILLPDMLSTMVDTLDPVPSAVLAFCGVITVDDDDHDVGIELVDERSAHAPSMDELLTRWWPILTSAALIRRSAFERAGGFSEAFTKPGFEDPFMWLVLRERGDFLYVPSKLVRYRTMPPSLRMMKYSKGYRIFGRLVSERYGDAGERLVRESSNAFVSAWGYAGLIALRNGDKQRAREAFACAMRYGPFTWRTTSRWLRTFLPLSAARALSGRVVQGSRSKPELENYFR